VDAQYGNTSQVDECRDSHHQPSSRTNLTSHQNVLAAGLAEYLLLLQHVSTQDCVDQQPPASFQSRTHEADASNTSQ